ncbi:hypothetical protein [Flavobacterium gawalongense]|uniref:hypothetical protein n=1 Tax=Flavobacterium gawalongense TaxID=2594432 RepID=UPI001F3C1DCB|nr:hypothetical protein [Flavobacterium gawalongense]
MRSVYKEHFAEQSLFIHSTPLLSREMMRFDTELPQDFQDCIEKWRGYSKSHSTDEEED